MVIILTFSFEFIRKRNKDDILWFFKLRWAIAEIDDKNTQRRLNYLPFFDRYDNKNQGGHYHKATGSVIKIRGRHGSRNSANGKIDETVYTGGPRR